MTIQHLMTAMTCLTTGCANAHAGFTILQNSAPTQLNILTEACNMELRRLRAQIIQNFRVSQEMHEQHLEQIETRLRNITQQLNGNATSGGGERIKRSSDSVPQLSQSCGMQNDGRRWLQLSGGSPPIEVLCVNSRYGQGWLLAAQLNTQQAGPGHRPSQRDDAIGFGHIDDLNEDYFIGSVQLHVLSNAHLQELLLVLEASSGVEHYAHFNAFALAGAAEDYKLRMLGHYEGDLAVAPLQASLGAPFSLSWLLAMRPAGRLSMFLRQKVLD